MTDSPADSVPLTQPGEPTDTAAPATVIEVLARYLGSDVLPRAVREIEAAVSQRAYALPIAEYPTSIADDHTVTHLPASWIEAAIKALDNRWDRGWTGGTISMATVVAAAFEAADRGEEPPMWADDDDLGVSVGGYPTTEATT